MKFIFINRYWEKQIPKLKFEIICLSLKAKNFYFNRFVEYSEIYFKFIRFYNFKIYLDKLAIKLIFHNFLSLVFGIAFLGFYYTITITL